ncbi:MAG: 4-alpha-glucanotransferase [Desulfuromonadaceae bacterium]|nr:4-alpha-glucanotransferase [Desulfuromonadaceae bacterium]
MLDKRGCGILLHPSSLPGSGGIGTLGSDARRYIDLLHAMGMSYWQVLPLTPPACGNSPYSAFTAFGGNPLLIDLERIIHEGDLSPDRRADNYPEKYVDFAAVTEQKMALLYQAASQFLNRINSSRFNEFCDFCESTPWLHNYALFMALKRRYHGNSWNLWPGDAARPTTDMRRKLSLELETEIAIQKYLQWQFARQWQELRSYANQRNISVIGDIPIFVAYDSADVWGNRDNYLLDENGKSTFVAGVPPDYFSATGQLWGNPLYDWRALKRSGYQWWIDRFSATFKLFDLVRVDHFRGFEAAWHIPADGQTAQTGEWVPGAGEELFDALSAALGPLAVIAEDLGVITQEVLALRDRYNFPGMKILQFAFDHDPANLPHNHVRHGVVYTGTHDNNTTQGWYLAASDDVRAEMHAYLGCDGDDGAGNLVRAALMSVANTVIIPLQDILKLGSEARMNVPGTPFGNWEWRFTWDMIPEGLATYVLSQVKRYDRVSYGENGYAQRSFDSRG